MAASPIIRRHLVKRPRRIGCAPGIIAAFAALVGGSGAGVARAQDPEILPIVGETPRPDQISPIEDPGTVGLGPGYPGSLYAIVAGHLVRIDAASGRIQSILRPLPAPPD